MTDDGDNDPIDAPILLSRLNTATTTNSCGTSGESRGAQDTTPSWSRKRRWYGGCSSVSWVAWRQRQGGQEEEDQ